MRRHAGYTFINVTGLAIGLAVCVPMLLYVRDALASDGFHTNSAPSEARKAARVNPVHSLHHESNRPPALFIQHPCSARSFTDHGGYTMLPAARSIPFSLALRALILAVPLAGMTLTLRLGDRPSEPPVLVITPAADEAALLALPPHRRAGTAIVAYTAEGTFETVREGTNGLFCITDRPDNDRFSVSCHPESMRAYLEFVSQLTEDPAARNRTLEEVVQSGSVALPAGAHSHLISGTLNPVTGVPDSVTIWSEVALPFATPEETGLDVQDAGEAPYLMSAGRYSAHVMIDTRKAAWQDLPGIEHSGVRQVK